MSRRDKVAARQSETVNGPVGVSGGLFMSREPSGGQQEVRCGAETPTEIAPGRLPVS